MEEVYNFILIHAESFTGKENPENSYKIVFICINYLANMRKHLNVTHTVTQYTTLLQPSFNMKKFVKERHSLKVKNVSGIPG